MMSILFVNEYNRPGGTETTIAELREGLAEKGIETSSYILADKDGHVIANESDFWKTMYRFHPDIIHLHNVGVHPPILDWVAESRLPLVWTLHDYWAICTTRMLFWGTKPCSIPCDHHCGGYREGIKEFVDNYNVELLVENPTSQWIFEQHGLHPRIITCGIDLDKWKFNSGSRKGIFFIQADPNAWWKGSVIAGRVARKLGKAMVSGKGTQAEICDALGKCEIVLIPSLYPETFCRVVAEAKACGTVPVAFDVAGPAYQIKDGQTGFLAKMDNELELYAKAQQALQVDEYFRQGLRKDIEEHWSLSKMVSEHIEIYRRQEEK